jgi:hypothetical protein
MMGNYRRFSDICGAFHRWPSSPLAPLPPLCGERGEKREAVNSSNWVKLALDKPGDFLIILQNSRCKGCEEDEYAPPRRHREQEKVRACPNRGAEWTSELQGKRETQ